MFNRQTWIRCGLVALAGAMVGCGAGPARMTQDSTQSTAAVPPRSAGYSIQQDMTPGPRGSRHRLRYCATWQCAFTAAEDRSWCMRRCLYNWDL